jgi:hypothetical protein
MTSGSKARGYWNEPGKPHLGLPGRRGGSRPRGGVATPALRGMAEAWDLLSAGAYQTAPDTVTAAELQRLQRRLREASRDGTTYLWHSGQPGRYLTPEERAEIDARLAAAWARRVAEVAKNLEAPDHWRQLLEGFPLDISRYDLRDDARKEAVLDLIEQRADWLLAWASPRIVALSELKGVLDRYSAQIDVELGQSEEGKHAHSWLMDVRFEAERQFEFMSKHEISLGLTTPAALAALNGEAYYRFGDADEWQPLPDVLYHVTTAKRAVLADRLRSRREMRDYSGGRGLGGGDNDTISLTTNLQTAKNIERAVHEAHAVLNGKLTIRDMLRIAAAGEGAEEPFAGKIAHQYHPVGVPGKPDYWDWLDFNPEHDPLPYAIRDLLKIDDGKQAGVSREKLLDERFEFYKRFAAARGHAKGGFEDPLFFGTNAQALRAIDPADIVVLKLRPRRGARGLQMSSLAEWRVVGGDTVEIDTVLDFYKPRRVRSYVRKKS